MQSIFINFFYQLYNIAPIFCLILTLVIIMILTLCNRNHFLCVMVTVSGLTLSIISIIEKYGKCINVYSLIYLDNFSYFYMCIILSTVLLISITSYFFLPLNSKNYEEFYLLMLSSTIGGSVLTSVNHLLSFFICVELITLPVFGMIGYVTLKNIIESRTKYILLSGISSSILLFGIALVYSDTGLLYFSEIGKIFRERQFLLHPIFMSGLGLMIIGISFKLSLFPFHYWIPDIYQFSPIPVSIFLSTVSKISIFTSIVRFFMSIPLSSGVIQLVIFSIAIISIFLGSIMALNQTNIKRILSYSSISHTGHLLIGLMVINNKVGLETIGIYIIGYIFANINVFIIIGIISKLINEENSKLSIQDLRGFFYKEPILALILTISIFSLSGIPMTIGFIGKFYLMFSIINSGFIWVSIILLISNIISLFYYLKIITNIYLHPLYQLKYIIKYNNIININKLFMLFSSILIIFLGIYPKPIITIIKLSDIHIY